MTIKENLQKAIAVLNATPTSQIDLDTFTCGTTHCAAGWLTTDPYFQRLGMGLRPWLEGRSLLEEKSWLDDIQPHKWILHDTRNPDIAQDYRFLDNIFGADAYEVLFEPYGHGEKDESIFENAIGYIPAENERPIPDKALALARLYLQYGKEQS